MQRTGTNEMSQGLGNFVMIITRDCRQDKVIFISGWRLYASLAIGVKERQKKKSIPQH